METESKTQSASNWPLPLREGFSCSQSVLAVFAPEVGWMRTRTARARRFRRWDGADRRHLRRGHRRVDGAGSQIWRHRGGPGGKRAHLRIDPGIIARFEARHGATTCADLLGVNIGTPEGQAAAREANLFKTTCPGLVASAAEIVGQMIARDHSSWQQRLPPAHKAAPAEAEQPGPRFEMTCLLGAEAV